MISALKVGTENVRLARIVGKLKQHYGPQSPPPVKTAFGLILWEYVAYLADDAKRAAAFAALKKRVGLTPRDILAADPADLLEIAMMGGTVGALGRAGHMRTAAELVVGEFDGSLERALKLPPAEAKRALKQFHGIGDPGAEKILLLTRTQAVLPLDSNAARTLCRIGYGADHKNYSTMYKSVTSAARPELPNDFDTLIDASVLLRHHGQQTCKTSAPRCEICPVRADCAFVSIASAPRSRARTTPSRPTPKR